MHLGMPECHKPFLGHYDLDLWSSFQELLCQEHISYIIWCRNPKFGMVIPLGMAEWCIPVWVTLTLTLTSGLISRFFVLYYSYFSSNVCYARPIPLGAFVTCLCHFLFKQKLSKESLKFRNILPVGNSVRSSQSANYELCLHSIFVDLACWRLLWSLLITEVWTDVGYSAVSHGSKD